MIKVEIRKLSLEKGYQRERWLILIRIVKSKTKKRKEQRAAIGCTFLPIKKNVGKMCVTGPSNIQANSRVECEVILTENRTSHETEVGSGGDTYRRTEGFKHKTLLKGCGLSHCLQWWHIR